MKNISWAQMEGVENIYGHSKDISEDDRDAIPQEPFPQLVYDTSLSSTRCGTPNIPTCLDGISTL